jgi:hypothetical protein
MAVHIKDVIKLLDCVKQAKKILSDLNGDNVVEVSKIQRFQVETDRLLEDIENDK